MKNKKAWNPADVKWLRSHLRMTQAELAQDVGVSRLTVTNWERGVKKPSLANMRKLDEIEGELI